MGVLRGGRMGWVAILNMVVRVGFIEKVTFEDLKAMRDVAMNISGERAF